MAANMLKYYSLLCILFAGNCMHATAQTSALTGKTYAVVIGVSTYKSKALPALQYADKDAKAFALWLQTKPGGNVPATQIKLLLNEEATIAAVYDALDWLKENCRSQDLGYIYFSGHGDVETKNNFSLGYLLAYNTPPNNYSNNAIRIEDLNNKANTLSLKNKAKVILITDACHAGKLAGDFYKGKQLVANQLRIVLNNEVRLTSCAADEEAAEGPDWGGGHGVFSYYLLKGLNGMAGLKKNRTIQLQELNKFLDSSFAVDKFLIADKHKQHPVTDGNPYFPLAFTDSATLSELDKTQASGDSSMINISAGLLSMKAIGLQPIDYFFAISQAQPLENYIDFESYSNATPETLPIKLLDERIYYQQQVHSIIDSVRKTDPDYFRNDIANPDSLKLLRNQLLKNKSLNERFNERFIELVHEKGQDMINAYLEGDLAELEKRQYYYAGNRQYRDFLFMLKVAIQIAPDNHSLTGLLKLNYSYLSGLIDRLEMATGDNADSLLNKAFIHQRQAMQQEPYAAYIHNELGNLFLHKKQFDSASYHFDLANVLSPTWSVPWSNKIRLNLAMNKLDKAKEAVNKADSLQPDLPYVMMNAGLVMEQEKDLLAAESFYKKAISKNTVHFFPYERLGKIYLQTGEYDRADSFLFDASLRKDQFALNDEYFKFGMELGGIPPPADQQQEHSACDRNFLMSPKNAARADVLLARAIGDPLPADSVAIFINKALQKVPGMPLAHHYLGKQLYQEGKLKEAAAVLLQAISNYQSNNNLKAQLIKLIYPNGTSATDTCLLQFLISYQYDVVEDYYLLGAVYEKLGWNDKAIDQYNIISAIENERQLNQAGYVGFDLEAAHHPELGDSIIAAYEGAIKMGGAIKAGRLYEQLGQYLSAEKVLLQQVSLNRTAGYKRQEALLSHKPGTWQLLHDTSNFYWLTINRNMEGETYRFYQAMMIRFPRDFVWKEKAGLFLYNRLALAFDKMPATEYASFYTSVRKFAYPWMAAENWARADTVTYELPGTHEEIQIELPLYDPLKQALAYLQQSVKLSGDVEPPPEVLEALAGLNSWTGNSEAGMQQYKDLLTVQPANEKARDKYINNLVAAFEFPDVSEQLNLAYKLRQIKPEQLLLLAQYKMLAGNFTEGKQVLENFKPRDAVEKNQAMELYARINWLNGQPAKALAYLLDSFSVIKIDPKDDAADPNINSNKQIRINFRLYSIARIYVLLKNNDKALMALKQALDAGFNYKLVLDNDTVWATLKHTPGWNALIKKYNFTVNYLTHPQETFRGMDRYRLP